MKKSAIIVLFSIFSFLKAYNQQRYEANWGSIDSRPIPTWFTDAKFGIFIHWGVYAVPAYAPVGKEIPVYSKYSEWYWYRLVNDPGKVGDAFRAYHEKTYGNHTRYTDFVNGFKADLFKPDDWADLFAASGAKYVVLTSKHHEGFTLWPSRESWNWNAVDVGPHRDVLGDLTNSVKNKGLRMGYYYSLYEWFNPLYKKDINKYVDDHMIPQMKDLVNTYKPDVLWTDGEWDHQSDVWKSTQFLSWLYNESPVKNSIVVNDRWGKETRSKHGGFYTTEYDLVHETNSRESKIAHPWEECRGIGGSFGYNRNENLADYNTSEELIHMLIEKVARGGNLLLDIGPAADGTIPVIMQQRLTDMGRWLKINGDAIYGTQSWDKAPAIPKEATVFFTQKGNDIYVLCTSFPEKAMVIENIKKPGSISLLGSGLKVKSSFSGGKLTITPPALKPTNTPGNYAWVFKLENAM